MLLTLLLSLVFQQTPAVNAQSLWDAAKAGDKAGVERALAAGVPVDAGTRYQQTALMFAAEKGHLAIVELLVSKGANVNQKDSFYGMTPIGTALQGGHADVARVLVEKGSDNANAVLSLGIRLKNAPLVTAALASPKLDTAALGGAVTAAELAGDAAIIAMVKDAAAKAPPAAAPSYVVPPALMQTYAGSYRSEDQSMTAIVTIQGGKLAVSMGGQAPLLLKPRAEGVFELEVAATST
ncbi:MAG: ankyrin repeat domain-containing protein, partial [Acidobacteriota bacterium]|nr:ankyrin repeat domain-containing protein [Acidobacteriota bacterium]